MKYPSEWCARRAVVANRDVLQCRLDNMTKNATGLRRLHGCVNKVSSCDCVNIPLPLANSLFPSFQDSN